MDKDPREVLLTYWLEHILGAKAATEKTQQIIQDWFQREGIDTFTEKYETDSKENRELRELVTLQDQWIKTLK